MGVVDSGAHVCGKHRRGDTGGILEPGTGVEGDAGERRGVVAWEGEAT